MNQSSDKDAYALPAQEGPNAGDTEHTVRRPPAAAPAPSPLGQPVRDSTVDLRGIFTGVGGGALPFPPARHKSSPPPPPAAPISPPVPPVPPAPTSPPVPPARTSPPVPPPARRSQPSWYTPEPIDRGAPPSSVDWRAKPPPVVAPNPIADQWRSKAAESAPVVPTQEEPVSAAPVAVAKHNNRLPQLLWFHTAMVPRLRREPAWAALLAAAMEAAGGVQDTDDFDEDEALEQDDRHDVFEIMVHGDALDLHQAGLVLVQASRKAGRLVTPLVLLEGILTWEFDELVQLEVALGATKPIAAHNEKLRNAVTAAEAFVEGSGGSPVPALAHTHTTALGNALGVGEMRTTVDGHVRRTLVEKRAFKRRKLLGETFVRASLSCDPPIDGKQQSAVLYIPEKAAALLPLFESIPVRVIGEFTPRQEQAESARYAVKLVAVARLITFE